MKKPLIASMLVAFTVGAVHAAEKITNGSGRDGSRSSDINKAAWAFLKEKRLEKEPQYQHYILDR